MGSEICKADQEKLKAIALSCCDIKQSRSQKALLKINGIWGSKTTQQTRWIQYLFFN